MSQPPKALCLSRPSTYTVVGEMAGTNDCGSSFRLENILPLSNPPMASPTPCDWVEPRG